MLSIRYVERLLRGTAASVADEERAKARMTELETENIALRHALARQQRRAHDELYQHQPSAKAKQPAADTPSVAVKELLKQLAHANAEIKDLKGKNTELGMELTRARKQAQLRAAESPSEVIKSLRGQVGARKAKAQPKPSPTPSDMETKLRKKIAELRWQLREVIDAPKGTVFIAAADRRKIRRCLHPDTQQDATCPKCGHRIRADKKRFTEAFQIFEGLPIGEIET